ncbi:MAG: pitrilysin family protein [candidate division WOR-3 bacterium]
MIIILILLTFSFQPIQVYEYQLDNWLKVLIYEDHFAPVVSVQVCYRVGSYNEQPGHTGISHLLEHMMFRGTKKFGPKEYDRLIDEAGGEENAFTSTHQTVYWANLYKDRYELALMLEADRMQNLLLAEKEFVPEKQVVMEERRLGENDPYGTFFETADHIIFLQHPYRQPVIGYMRDLQNIKRDDVYHWYRKYYNPANAIIIISGDVKREEVLSVVKKYFGRIKPLFAQEAEYYEPPQNGERRFTLIKKEVNQPALIINYRAVNISHPDAYVFEVIRMILASGKTSRFEKILVREKGLAADIDAYTSLLKYDGTFSIFAIPQIGIELENLEKEIYAEIERLKRGEVTDEELQKAQNQTLANFTFRQDSPSGIGFAIGYWEILTGSWKNLNLYPEKILGVTRADIERVANQYFKEENRTVGYLLPGR